MAHAAYEAWIGIPTLVCSTASAIATGLVIMMWILSRNDEKWSFRYTLVMNLTIAEFINSWNNTLSGFVVVSTGSWLTPGSACSLNGWIGQMSVQAADFSVLAIACVTLMTVNFNSWALNCSVAGQRWVCALVWVIPVITATTALLTKEISPVTGNWCWISSNPPYLRYVLGHGWRFAIFLAVIGIYIGFFVSLRRRLSVRSQSPTLNSRYSFSMYTDSASDVNVSMVNNQLIRGKTTLPTAVREAVTRTSSQHSLETGLETSQQAKLTAQTRMGIKPRVRVTQSSALDHDMRHWLLLSLFPMAYIIIWIPGIANRFLELLGQQEDWMIALQATTQLTGVVNAVVYGFREHRAIHRRKNEAIQRIKAKSLDLDV